LQLVAVRILREPNLAGCITDVISHHRSKCIIKMIIMLEPDSKDIITENIHTQHQDGSRCLALDFIDVLVEMLGADQVKDAPGFCPEQERMFLLFDKLYIQH